MSSSFMGCRFVRTHLFSLVVALHVLLVLTSPNALAQDSAGDAESAERLAQDLLIFDGHIDTPYRLSQLYTDVSEAASTVDFDLPRALDGGLNAAFMAVYVPTVLQERPRQAYEHVHRTIDLVQRMAATSDRFEIATSPSEVRAISSRGGIAIALSMENAAGLGGEISTLSEMRDRGIRYITLLHADHNRLGDASYDKRPPRWDGLSPFGVDVVREMNRLGMMVDVSHASDATTRDVLRVTTAPVIASHSSCRRYTPGWERNLSDDLIRGIADTGGVVLVNFGSNFLRGEYRAQEARVRRETYGYIEAQGWPRTSPEAIRHRHVMRTQHPVGTVADVADHIDHVVQIAGIDHVGIGSDFDGIFALPENLQDVSGYPNLIAELLDRGYTRTELDAIFGGNLLRVWAEVTEEADR